MSKNLKVIQTFAKIARIVTKVLFIIMIVSGAASLVGALTVFGVPTLKIFGQNLIDLIMGAESVKLESAGFECLSATVACASSAVVMGFASHYLKNELRAGTPFTYEGAKEILRLGIISIAVPAGASTVIEIINTVHLHYFPDAFAESFSVSISAGLLMIVAHFVFKYGAELAEKKNDADAAESETDGEKAEAKVEDNKEE